MNKKLLFSYLVFTFLSFKLFAQENFEGSKIEEIKINFESQDPNAKFDPKNILTKLKTKKGDIFSQNTFDSDLKMLSKEFYSIKPNLTLKNEELYIALTLQPNPKINKITWEGNKIIKTKKLQKELGIKEKQTFVKEKFNKALNKVKDFLIKKGFFESEITYTLTPIEKKDEVNVNIKITEGKSGKVKNIVFKGFTKEEEKYLKKTMYTKKYNILYSWLTGSGIFNKDAIEQDQMTIMEYLNNKGYADAKVDILFLEDPKSKKLIVKIIAHRGTIYHFGNVSFSGNTIFPNEKIEERLLIKKGDVFSPEKLRNTAKAIKSLYGQKGYIETQVLQETTFSEKEPIYDVNFEIIEGSQFKVGLIYVFGNSQTSTNVILRESLLTPGEFFDSRRIEATQFRLQNIGYFKNVNVYTVKSDLNDNYRDVYIEVEEAPTGSANASLGFSKIDEIFGSFELTERNFNAKGLFTVFSKGSSSLRGAGEYAHAKATIGQKERSYLITWMDPYFLDSLWRIGFEGSKTYSRLESKDYKTITYGFSFFTSYPLSNFWTFGSKYRLRHSETKLKHSIESKEDKDIEDNHGLISAIGSSISYDSTDRAYKAHRGLRSSLSTEFSGLGGDFYFFKFHYLNSLFIPVWEKGTLKLTANLKFLKPVGKTNRDDLPLSEKYFLGGEKSVRGYKPFILGPRRPGNSDDPIGGISSTFLSCEYLQAIIPRLDAFVFFDSGSISGKQFSIPKLNSSYGVGIRLELMNRTPMIIGYGIPINPDHKGDKRKFFFSMGGQF